MRLIVISSPDVVEHEAQTVNQLFEAGMGCFHLRKPAASPAELKSFLDKLNPHFRKDVVLHQHHGLASEFNIKRLHYTESARLNIDSGLFQNQLESGFSLSSSIHDFAEISKLTEFNYIFFGPVFNSISKPGYKGNLPANFRLKKINPAPSIIALGGIETDNICMVRDMMFDGAAVLGAIWNKGNSPLENFIQLNDSLKTILND